MRWPPTPGRLRSATWPLVLALFACQPAGPGSDTEWALSNRGRLNAGTVTATIEPGERHHYALDLPRGHAARIEAGQDDLDLLLRVFTAQGRLLFEADRPLGTGTPEVACWTSVEGGSYVIEIEPYDAGGTYQLVVLPTRPALPADRACHDGTVAYEGARTANEPGLRARGYRAAASAWQAADERLLAALATRQAGIEELKRGAPAAALDDYARALELARAAEQPALAVSIWNRIGRTHEAAGDLDQAATAFDNALTLARAAADPHGEATTLTNYGALDNARGDPFRAIDRYRDALSIWRQLAEPIQLAQALTNLGEALGALDHHEEALDALDEALTLARAMGDRRREASILTQIGWVHRLARQPGEALEPLRRALAIGRDLGDGSEIGALDRLGTALRESGDPAAAERHYRRALKKAGDDADGLMAPTLVNLGCLLAETDRPEEAAALLVVGAAHIDKLDDPRAAAHTAYCQARLANHRGAYDAADRHIRRTMVLIEAIYQRARLRGHGFPPVGLWQDYADFAVLLRIEHHLRTGDAQALAVAFAAADRNRARRLYELTAFTQSGAASAARRANALQVRALQSRLATLAAERTAHRAEFGLEALEAEIRRQQRALTSLRAADRAVADARGPRASPRAVTAAEAQMLLAPGTVLLTYVQGDSVSYLLVLSRETLEVHTLPPRAVLEAHAEGLHAALAASHLDPESNGQWSHVAARFGPMLLPAGAIPPGTERLLISAQGALHYVPFTVLPSPRPSPRPGDDDTRRIIDDFETVSVPSASVLAALRRRHTEHGRPPHHADDLLRVAVFADPVFADDDPRFGQHRAAGLSPGAVDRGIMLDRLPEGPLPRLPATADEAKAIGECLESDQLHLSVGWDATKRAVLDTDLQPFDILHFATHAWVDERFPELSGLVLTTIGPDGVPRDGALYLHEIDSLQLQAELTVLSGCQTALGRRIRGDGLMSLTQGFLNAGSRQVLVSLWSVSDLATSRLMAVFYQRLLRHGERPATALRHAQQWLRHQPGYAAPRYWAPFVLQGDG